MYSRQSFDTHLCAAKLEHANTVFHATTPPNLGFEGWDDRLGSGFSNATADEAARYVALRQGYYLADASGREAALAAWRASALQLANWAGVKRDFAALFAVPIGFVVMIGVSLFTPQPGTQEHGLVERLRSPGTAGQ